MLSCGCVVQCCGVFWCHLLYGVLYLGAPLLSFRNFGSSNGLYHFSPQIGTLPSVYCFLKAGHKVMTGNCSDSSAFNSVAIVVFLPKNFSTLSKTWTPKHIRQKMKPNISKICFLREFKFPISSSSLKVLIEVCYFTGRSCYVVNSFLFCLLWASLETPQIDWLRRRLYKGLSHTSERLVPSASDILNIPKDLAILP